MNRTTTFTYDERNLQTSITDPLGHTSTTEYDSVGNAIAIIDPLGNKTNYNYDPLYRLTSQTDAQNRTTNYSYDPLGNLLSLSDPEDNTTTYTYDELNRLISDTNQLGDSRSYEYDAVGNLIHTTDRNSREIEYVYDKLDRNTSEVWLDEDNNPLRTFEFNYDAASQLKNASDPDSVYSYTYDKNGRITSVDNAGTPNLPNVVFDYTYDGVGNLTSITDAINGVAAGVETFSYDALNRVSSLTQSGTGVSDKRVDYQYDAAFQLIEMSRYGDLIGNQKVANSNYTYDEAGRLINLVHERDGEVLSAYEWAYDQANRITQATSPDGTSDYNYDKTDQLVGADHSYQDDENYTYDENGNRTNPGYVTGENNQLLSDGKYNYEYDGEGNRTKRTSIVTGEVTEYEWDYRNRLTGVVTKDGSGNVIKQADYTYDVFDRRIAKSVDVDGNGVAEKVERFVYDGDNIALTFDGEGNQKERFFHGVGIDEILAQENQDGEVLWAISDNQGSVRDVVDGDGTVVNHITYDSFGKVTSETDSNVDFRFGYVGKELDPETGLRRNGKRYVEGDRFISEDPIAFAGGDSNLYRYVNNSPVNYVDPLGLFLLTPDNSNPTYVPMPVGGGGLRNTIPTPPPSGLPNSLPPVVNPSRENPFDPLQINPDQKSNPFFPNFSDLFEKPNDWFKRMREFIEDIREENDEKEKEQDRDNNSDSCGWGDRDKYLPPQNSSQNGDNNDESIIESTSTLAEASDAANQAADNVDNWTPKNKHLQSTTAKRAAKFNTDDVNDVRDIVQEALRSPDAQFFPNNTDGSVRVVTDLKRPIGTKGQTKVRVIIGNDGEIWNAFPVNTN